MTALQSPPTSNKPSLHLSLAPSTTPTSAHITPSSSSTSLSRRIGSWGSATSDTYHALQALGDESLTGLPSPLDLDRDRREFGFLPPSSSTGGGGGGDWQSTNSWARSTGRGRGNSIFEEIRDGSINSSSGGGGYGGGWDSKPSNLGASTSSWLSASSLSHSHSVPTTNGTNTPRRASPPLSSPPADRNPPERSKTLSFFGGASTSSLSSSTFDRSNGALSPPPNPPSRSGSLKDSYRGYGHGKDASGGSSASGGAGSWASGTVGGWGAFPSPSATPAPPPPLAPFPSSSPSAALSPLHDPLRSSVASSSGGSWLDEAADGEQGTGLWTRGRGGSIGSKSGAAAIMGTRQESPARYERDWRRGEEETPSPVSALRPRLAALNTSTLSPPTAPSPVSHFSSASSVAPSPTHNPLSSLPSAYPSDVPQPPSFSSAASASRAARFLHFSQQQQQQHPLQAEQDYPARSASVPLYASTAFAPIHDSPSTPHASPQRSQRGREPERVKKSSAGSSVATSATTTPSRPTPREPRPSVVASSPAEEDPDVDALPLPQKGDKLGEYVVERLLGKGAFSRVALAKRDRDRDRDQERAAGKGRRGSKEDKDEKEKLVALKLVARTACEGNERMRISVLREVEVLKNIHHPSLVSLSSTYQTPLYTVLVLDYCPGGELFDFLADWHTEISEGLARRMFTELCSAVGWMHEIGLVHRDIKLENILLTSRPFPTTSPSSVLSTIPSPFLKLTDFGLSRFINPTSPLLSTRCGSEAYAAPELIMGKKYDGRATDAWALGVVLFAIITGVMPFVEEPDAGPKGRRAYLLKIAKADYRWLGQEKRGSRLSITSSVGGGTPSSSPTKSSHSHGSSLSSVSTAATSPPPTSSTFPRSSTSSDHPPQGPAASPLPSTSTSSAPPTPPATSSTRLITPSVQSLVARLLVRDPSKRAKVDFDGDLWKEEWMRGEGAVKPVRGVMRRRSAGGGGKGEEDEGWARRGSELLD